MSHALRPDHRSLARLAGLHAFLEAKGGKPRSQHIRDLAWVVVRWAEEAKPHLPLLAYLPPRWAGMEARV